VSQNENNINSNVYTLYKYKKKNTLKMANNEKLVSRREGVLYGKATFRLFVCGLPLPFVFHLETFCLLATFEFILFSF
jgi:hypothetical protein